MANIIKGIQTMYNQIRRRYVPIIKVPSLANLKTKFNSISQITLQGYLTDEMIRLSNVLIRDGRLGENIMFFKTTRRLIGKKAEIDCIALLTDEALYCLNTQYDIDTRLELKNIISVVLAETMDQVIIEKSNGERELWMLPSKFVTDLEKVIAGTKQRRLTVAIKNKADINDFVKGYI